MPTHTFATAPPLDVLIVPGGTGTRAANVTVGPAAFVRQRYPELKYLMSVCTGAAILAQSGVLDGRRATTNKAAFAWVKTQGGAEIEWVPKARWVVDGNVYTTSGVAAGMDGTYALVREIYGEEVSRRVADNVEYERHTDSSWDPFSDLYNLTNVAVNGGP